MPVKSLQLRDTHVFYFKHGRRNLVPRFRQSSSHYSSRKAYTTPRETPRFQFLLLEPLPIMMTSKLGKSDVGILGWNASSASRAALIPMFPAVVFDLTCPLWARFLSRLTAKGEKRICLTSIWLMLCWPRSIRGFTLCWSTSYSLRGIDDHEYHLGDISQC